ncbi:MAG: Flp pilus assembly protein CpaB [Anaerolineales bacterium]
MRRGRILILLALILLLGAVAGFLVLTRLGGGGQPAIGPEPQATEGPSFGGEAQIVIAAQDISRGSEIPSDGVILSPFPADWVVETMVTDLDQVVGRRARADIARGVPLTERMITDDPGDVLATGSAAAVVIPPGQTAISIPMNRFSGVAYSLREGDNVDVIVSLLFLDIDPEFQTELPNRTAIFVSQTGEILTATGATQASTSEEGTETSSEDLRFGRIDTEEETGQQVYLVPDPESSQRPRLVSQRLVENATVLGVGEFPLPEEEGEEETEEEEQPAGAPEQQQQAQEAQQAPEAPTIVTLIMPPQDALAVKWALQAGADLTLTLRSPGDETEDATTSVTLQYLIDNYNISVPSKLPYGTEPRLQADPRQIEPSLSGSSPAPVTE